MKWYNGTEPGRLDKWPLQLQPSFIFYNLIKIHRVPGESRSVDVPKDKPAPFRSVHVLCWQWVGFCCPGQDCPRCSGDKHEVDEGRWGRSWSDWQWWTIVGSQLMHKDYLKARSRIFLFPAQTRDWAGGNIHPHKVSRPLRYFGLEPRT